MCLRNVRMGYEIAPLYDDAWTAWLNTEQHKNRSIPLGVDVPLFYSFTATIGGVRKNYGHINVRLKDGRIWNDGNIFSNLSSFEQSHSNVSYVGWGESVNKVRVIKENNVCKVTTNIADHYYRLYIGTGVSEWGKQNAVGKMTPVELQKHLTSSSTYKQLVKDAKSGNLAVENHLPTALRNAYVNPLNEQLEKATRTINDKQTEVEILQDDVADLKAERKELQKELEETLAELALVGDDTVNLNKLGEMLRWFIARIGVK
jgi:hypothetical protein